MATIYRKREDTAQLIFDWLKVNGDSSWVQIQRGCGLTECQLGYGLGYLKDELQTRYGRPLVWSPRRGVYALTSNEGEWLDYVVQFRAKSIRTQLFRLERTCVAGGMYFGTRRKAVKQTITAVQLALAAIETA